MKALTACAWRRPLQPSRFAHRGTGWHVREDGRIADYSPPSVIAFAQAICPSKPRVLAMSR
jgi:hypothetical protein